MPSWVGSSLPAAQLRGRGGEQRPALAFLCSRGAASARRVLAQHRGSPTPTAALQRGGREASELPCPAPSCAPRQSLPKPQMPEAAREGDAPCSDPARSLPAPCDAGDGATRTEGLTQSMAMHEQCPGLPRAPAPLLQLLPGPTSTGDPHPALLRTGTACEQTSGQSLAAAKESNQHSKREQHTTPSSGTGRCARAQPLPEPPHAAPCPCPEPCPAKHRQTPLSPALGCLVGAQRARAQAFLMSSVRLAKEVDVLDARPRVHTRMCACMCEGGRAGWGSGTPGRWRCSCAGCKADVRATKWGTPPSCCFLAGDKGSGDVPGG